MNFPSVILNFHVFFQYIITAKIEMLINPTKNFFFFWDAKQHLFNLQFLTYFDSSVYIYTWFAIYFAGHAWKLESWRLNGL